jgi:hypothetical protein
MGGGLMQLVAYGAQDIYLSGNPQITFFKVVYRRHTNFSMEAIDQTFNGSADFGKKVTCTISRNGDLISRVYVQVSLPALAEGDTYLPMVGHKLIKSVEIEIGGQRIDKHYGDWLHIWNELSQTEGHWKGYELMVSGVDVSPDNMGLLGHDGGSLGSGEERTLYIPLQFWFCRNPGLALPLIALQYHEVKINVEFNSLSKCAQGKLIGGTPQKGNKEGDEDPSSDTVPKGKFAKNSDNYVPAGPPDTPGPLDSGSLSKTMDSATLYVDYIYLDTDERRRFAQVTHEYLIEQLQFTGDEKAQSKIKLNFNHPVKELVWVEQVADGVVGEYATSYSEAHIQLNGHDRTSARKPTYYQLVQPYQHHERVPTGSKNYINVYSFALKPEEHQPSGTCNMSRIDNATLNLKGVSTDNTVKVYAVNYNVLRIMSGMGGLAYSN